MKKLILLLLFIPLVSFGQYSTYYGTYDVNVNADVNINKNVNVSGNVNKTVTTIDYGALANANATRERNRIESLKVANERDRDAMLAIANDPSKAFDYGRDNTWYARGKDASGWGFKKFTHIHRVPHESLFVRISGFSYQNISDNYITTEIELSPPIKIAGLKDKQMREIIKDNFKGIFNSVEEFAKRKDMKEGEFYEKFEAFIHKKDINKTKIFGVAGFKDTVIYEDDYEIVIKDNYNAVVDGMILNAGVRFKADKDEVTFEQLEGRRYYLRKLVEQMISAQKFEDVK